MTPELTLPGANLPGDSTGSTADVLGLTLAGAGDVNGDGIDDLLIGSQGSSAHVVFGTANFVADSIVDVSFREQGFNITSGGNISPQVAGAGDVNGDGLKDLLIGGVSGAYVVFGKKNSLSVDLVDVSSGIGGFFIVGEVGEVSAVGDVNADGFDDVIFASPETGYVVFGKADTNVVQLDNLGGRGFAIEGVVGGFPSVSVESLARGEAGGIFLAGASGGSRRTKVAMLGDINQDGLADILLGAPYASAFVGRAYVLYGLTRTLTVIGNAGDRLGVDLAQYISSGSNGGLDLWIKEGGVYGLQISPDVEVFAP